MCLLFCFLHTLTLGCIFCNFISKFLDYCGFLLMYQVSDLIAFLNGDSLMRAVLLLACPGSGGNATIAALTLSQFYAQLCNAFVLSFLWHFSVWSWPHICSVASPPAGRWETGRLALLILCFKHMSLVFPEEATLPTLWCPSNNFSGH